jgi:hypothetical protein
MAWLTVMEYLWHKWPQICSTCRKHFQILSSSITYRRVCTWINTTGVTSGAGTAYPSRAHEFTPSFQWDSCNSICSCMYMFCRSLFVLLDFFYWPLCFLFFFDMPVGTTRPVVSPSALTLTSTYRYHWNWQIIINVLTPIIKTNVLFHLSDVP